MAVGFFLGYKLQHIHTLLLTLTLTLTRAHQYTLCGRQFDKMTYLRKPAEEVKFTKQTPSFYVLGSRAVYIRRRMQIKTAYVKQIMHDFCSGATSATCDRNNGTVRKWTKRCSRPTEMDNLIAACDILKLCQRVTAPRRRLVAWRNWSLRTAE